MKKQFPEYYPLNLNELWKTCLFCFDASVLQDLYRFSDKATKQFVEHLTSLQSQIWLPHQAALEYQRARIGMIRREIAPYDKIREGFPVIEKHFQAIIEHSFVKPQILARFRRMSTNLLKDIDAGKKAHEEMLVTDPIFNKLTELFDGRTGEPYSPEKLAEILKEWDERKDKNIPPGYKDRSKEEGDPYGDFLIWKQMLDKAQSHKQGIIFVTNDAKEDWWHKWTNGPRLELRIEMDKVASCPFHLLTFETFLDHAGRMAGTPVAKDVVAELEAVANQRKREAVAEWLRAHPDTLADRQTEAIEMFHEFGYAMESVENWCDKRLADTNADTLLLPNLLVLGRHLDKLGDRWKNRLTGELRRKLLMISSQCEAIQSLSPEGQVQEATGLRPLPRDFMRTFANVLGMSGEATVHESVGDLGISAERPLQQYVHPITHPMTKRYDRMLRTGEFSQLAALVEDWCKKATDESVPRSRLLSLLATIDRRLELFGERWGDSLPQHLSQQLGRMRVLCDSISSLPQDDSLVAHLHDAAVILMRSIESL